MILIATGQPRAKLDEEGEAIELRIPSGSRESVTLDLTPNQAMMLEQQLKRCVIEFMQASRARANATAANVLAFPRR